MESLFAQSLLSNHSHSEACQFTLDDDMAGAFYIG